MSNNEKYTIKDLSFDSMLDELNETSPLQMSKRLIEYELYDQQESIEVLNQVYEEFESKDNIIDSLVNPMLLNLADGLIKHPKLNGTFRKTNITPSRLVNEVNAFNYENNTQKGVDDDVFLTQAEKTHYGNFQRSKFYDTKSRRTTEQEKGISRTEELTHTDYDGTSKTIKTATVEDAVTGEKLDITREGASVRGMKPADMDHVIPINSLRKKYKNNPYLYRDDLEKIAGLSENESYINSSLNISKGDMTWGEYIKKYPNKLTKKQQEKALGLEKKANKAQNKEAAIAMAKNAGLKGMGDIIVLLLKPIWFEIKDMFKNGVLHGFDTDDKIEAFLFRLKRIGKFINDNVLNTLGDSLKDVFGNFIPMLINLIAGVFTGMFKKIIQIISDGFMAIKEAFKIMMKPDSEVSPAQKADAITKIIASAIVPIVIFAFEKTILSGLEFLEDTPFGFLKDVAMIILSGLATTLAVWLLDQIDLFSVKDEKRMMRVKEIFELRIEAIKKNTDIFEKASLEALAKQKLQFRKIADDMSNAIDNNLPVNDTVHQMADFMKIDLKVKSTDDFLHLLSTNEKLAI